MSDPITQALIENNSVFHEAAGNLSFLLSVIRCGEQLSDDEVANVRRVIDRLAAEEKTAKVLTAEEWGMIEDWYNSAAGESASGMSCQLREHVTTQEAFDRYYAEMLRTKALVDKLGFEYAHGDAYNLRKHGLIPPEAEEPEVDD